MPRKPRFGQRGDWHFSDGGVKFDGRPRKTRRSTQKPISPALKRGVIHCARCNSRVVGNTDHCPFCGASLRPVFARLWFWLIVVVVVAVGVIWGVGALLPEERPAPSSPAAPERPQVVGGDESSSLKNLAEGTCIDNSGLEVTVDSITLGPVAANGAQIYIVAVEFFNTGDESINLYSTQWMLETSDGNRLDTFVGPTADGATLSSNFESYYELVAHGHFSGRLYFALPQPTAPENPEEAPAAVLPAIVVYQPSALAYSEDMLVTWNVSLAGAAQTEGTEAGGTDEGSGGSEGSEEATPLE